MQRQDRDEKCPAQGMAKLCSEQRSQANRVADKRSTIYLNASWLGELGRFGKHLYALKLFRLRRDPNRESGWILRHAGGHDELRRAEGDDLRAVGHGDNPAAGVVVVAGAHDRRAASQNIFKTCWIDFTCRLSSGRDEALWVTWTSS